MLQNGNDGHYATDHAACMAVALAAVRAGWTRADFVREMSEPTNALSAHYRFKDPERGRRTRRRRRGVAAAVAKMGRDWSKAVAVAVAQPQVHGRTEALQQLGVYLAAVQAASWMGAVKLKLQQLLLELVVIGMAQGSMTPTISSRDLGDRPALRVYASTISRRISKLVAMGWVEVVESSDPALPNSYRLVIPPCDSDSKAGVQKCNMTMPLTRGVRGVAFSDSSEVPALQLDADVQALHGTTGAAVLAAVAAGARGVAEIRRWTGLARQTVYSCLAYLRKVKLLVRDALGRLVDNVRGARGELGPEVGARDAKRIARHTFERSKWKDVLLSEPWRVYGRGGGAAWKESKVVQALLMERQGAGQVETGGGKCLAS